MTMMDKPPNVKGEGYDSEHKSHLILSVYLNKDDQMDGQNFATSTSKIGSVLFSK